jgi:hypothetical protein
MKVFISHKDVDSATAQRIGQVLERYSISYYLDVLNNLTELDGKRLTHNIRQELNKCSHMITVLSENTKQSWWVPFEIGMAAQKDVPVVNFLVEGIALPSYLEYWPRLKNISELDKFVSAIRLTDSTIQKSAGYITESYSEKFYKNIRSII